MQKTLANGQRLLHLLKSGSLQNIRELLKII
jgi:hypothetical protein